MELRIMLLKHDLAFLVREATAAEPFLHLDWSQARLGEVNAHDGPEASLVELPEEQGRGHGADAVDGGEFLNLFGRQKLIREGQTDPPH